MSATLSVYNGDAVDVCDVPELSVAEFRDTVIREVNGGARIAAFFGQPADGSAVRLIAVLAKGDNGTLLATGTVVRKAYPALTPDCTPAHWFEREIAEQCAIEPKGHPWLKPIRSPNATTFFGVEGAEVHEVAVGPVHAGIIEPGHFRFQCHGEHVLHLEIALGYQHRGVERALVGGPSKRTIHYVETLAGDTSVGHATAYCQAVEALSGDHVPARAEVLRGVALELERLANHTGDLGALAGDVGYLPTAAYCGRLRGDFLNMTALICGNRFSRGLIVPGGVAVDLDAARVHQLLERLEGTFRDVTQAVNLLWETPSVQTRFENTGPLSQDLCIGLGLVGPVARACGVERDVRHEFPSGIFRFAQIPVYTWHSGDVFARAHVRWLEMQRSAAFIREQLATLPDGPIRIAGRPLAANRLAVSLVEGWRGEICHVASTDDGGRFIHYKVVDPSFHNWFGLAMALRDQQISDFPLCNKSFNLSYCGHDL